MKTIEAMRAAARAHTPTEKPESDPRVAAALAAFDSPASKLGDSTRGFVRRTIDFDRVASLPRVEPWQNSPEVDSYAEEIVERFGVGTMEPFRVQAAALLEVERAGGLFASIGVGEGKTLISYLAGAVLDVRRVLVLVPAKLVEKTERDFVALAKHFRGPEKADVERDGKTWTARGAGFHVLSYELLGTVGGAGFLDAFSPDLIVADECQALRNVRASRTKRVLRYFGENPHVHGVMLSGTVSSRSIRDFHHLLACCLGTDAMPLPVAQSELSVWARAVDVDVEQRARAGALSDWTESDDPTLEELRAAVGTRIFETPGALQTFGTNVRASILLDFFEPKLTREQREILRRMETEKVDSMGEPCTPADVSRHTKTVVAGFSYVWDPPPPEDWLRARRAWKRFARDVLDADDPRWDSELQVSNACESGELDDFAWKRWKRIRKTYNVAPVPDWITLDVMEQVVDAVDGTETIVWVEHRATGAALAALTGWPYYANKGLDDAGNFIDDDEGGRPIIASIAANAEGRNLQRWSRNFVVSPPSSGKTWEQLIGRTHRTGQAADTVEIVVMLGRAKIRGCMVQAFEDAAYLAPMFGPQRLLFADSTRDFRP